MACSWLHASLVSKKVYRRGFETLATLLCNLANTYLWRMYLYLDRFFWGHKPKLPPAATVFSLGRTSIFLFQAPKSFKVTIHQVWDFLYMNCMAIFESLLALTLRNSVEVLLLPRVDERRRGNIFEITRSSLVVYPITTGSMYAIYGNMDPINIPPLC